MISFSVSLVALILGYLLYGRFVEKVFGPDDRVTPAVAKADGIDYIVLPNWKIFMIQFLNIAGTGPIFGAIMGAQFGPAAYLWIVLGCIFAGSVHDYLSGMLSLRNGGINQPEIIGSYLGKTTKKVMLVFAVFLLMMVGAVFVYSPATLLQGLCVTHVPSVSLLSDSTFWIIIIFVYYLIATMLPIDKIIGKVYPLFAVSLLFMAAALLVMLFVKKPDIPELWEGLPGAALTPDAIFPCLFITIACGAISGFHATQSPLMARCMRKEKQGRPIFYGAMITEGIVALIWATVAMYFFYDQPTPGYETILESLVVFLPSWELWQHPLPAVILPCAHAVLSLPISSIWNSVLSVSAFTSVCRFSLPSLPCSSGKSATPTGSRPSGVGLDGAIRRSLSLCFGLLPSIWFSRRSPMSSLLFRHCS